MTSDGVTARIVAEHRGAYHAANDDGVAWVEVTGVAYHEAADKRALPTVGDWVVVDGWAAALAGGGNAVVREILPRRSLIVRKAAGEATAPQPLAANVDLGLVLTSANQDLSPERIDRYLSILRDGDVFAHVLLTKVDLVDDDLAAQAAELLGVPVTLLSNVRGDGIDIVRELVGPGVTAVLLGSSGVGKSSLLNRLVGSDKQLVRPIRAFDDKGRHTTNRRELFAIPGGGCIIDTPGMRELGQWIEDEDDADKDDTFEDIAELAASCRFSDCRHGNEPGCAVAGKVDEERLDSYLKLVEERAIVAKNAAAAKRIAETRRAKAKRYIPRDDK